MREVSLVRSPANLLTRPVQYAKHDITTDGGGQPHGLPLSWRSAWDRAHQALRGSAYQRAADGLTIDDVDPLDPADEELTDLVVARTRAKASATAMLRASLDEASRADERGVADVGVERTYRHTYPGVVRLT